MAGGPRAPGRDPDLCRIPDLGPELEPARDVLSSSPGDSGPPAKAASVIYLGPGLDPEPEGLREDLATLDSPLSVDPDLGDLCGWAVKDLGETEVSTVKDAKFRTATYERRRTRRFVAAPVTEPGAEGTPTTYEEACERADALNGLLRDVMEG